MYETIVVLPFAHLPTPALLALAASTGSHITLKRSHKCLVLLCVLPRGFSSNKQTESITILNCYKFLFSGLYVLLNYDVQCNAKIKLERENFLHISSKLGSRDGAVVKTLASLQCGLNFIPAPCHMWVKFVVSYRLASTVFSPGSRFSSFR